MSDVEKPTTCRRCSGPIPRPRSNKFFCCAACRKAAWLENAGTLAPCEYCADDAFALEPAPAPLRATGVVWAVPACRLCTHVLAVQGQHLLTVAERREHMRRWFEENYGELVRSDPETLTEAERIVRDWALARLANLRGDVSLRGDSSGPPRKPP